MGISLEKVQQQAPHLVDLVKKTKVNLEKQGFDPEANRAAVVATVDCSGSTQRLYATGEIHKAVDMAFAAGLVFDDDGDVPVSLFDNDIHDMGSITLSNCKGFIPRTPYGGGTSYITALKWIIDQAGYSGINLSNTSKPGGFFGRAKAAEGPQQVKATAPYPMFAIFVTDGEPQDRHEHIYQLITQMSQLPIFIQFIGVGQHNFSFLHTLDDMQGRFIDNCGFFDSKEAGSQDQMLAGLLNEFPEYYKKARTQGLISDLVSS